MAGRYGRGVVDIRQPLELKTGGVEASRVDEHEPQSVPPQWG